MSRNYDGGAGAGRSLPQLLSLVIGVVYTLIGILGFFVTGFDNFASVSNKALLGFEVNPLHNLVHLLVGVAGIALSRTLSGARTYGWALAVAYGLVTILGFVGAGDFLSLNGADNVLHLLSTIAGLAIALMPVARGARV